MNFALLDIKVIFSIARWKNQGRAHRKTINKTLHEINFPSSCISIYGGNKHGQAFVKRRLL